MDQPTPKLRVAAKAIIVNEKGQVLIVREASTYSDGTNIGHFGVPGGRIELGETYADGLRREVIEEVGLEIKPLYPIFVDEWHPVIKGQPHQIIGIYTACQASTNKIRLSEEHDQFLWIDPKQRAKYDIMEHDWQAIESYNNHPSIKQ
jgi:8-oxo-dGTP diphosphatase